MAKKTKLQPHVHVWEVGVQYDQNFCLCTDECTCERYAYAIATCSVCRKELSADEIATILNGKKGPQE